MAFTESNQQESTQPIDQGADPFGFALGASRLVSQIKELQERYAALERRHEEAVEVLNRANERIKRLENVLNADTGLIKTTMDSFLQMIERAQDASKAIQVAIDQRSQVA